MARLRAVVVGLRLGHPVLLYAYHAVDRLGRPNRIALRLGCRWLGWARRAGSRRGARPTWARSA